MREGEVTAVRPLSLSCVCVSLQVVFSQFVNQLQGLEKPSALSFRYSFHLLECLATTKAFNLCLSLDSQDILADLFKMMFAIVKSVDLFAHTHKHTYMYTVVATVQIQYVPPLHNE